MTDENKKENITIEDEADGLAAKIRDYLLLKKYL